MNTFKDKLVLITGASSGIGLAFAQLLAKQGAHLVLVARHLEKLEEIASELKKRYGILTYTIAADLAEIGSAQKLFAQTEELKLSVDILINNAGFGKWGALLDFDTDVYNSMVQLNITTLTDLCCLYLPKMLDKKAGGIINVASIAAFQPVPYAAVYSATKSYVLNFSEALYGEYGDQGVTIMALCPGGTKTNFATVADPSVNVDSSFKASAETVAQDGLNAFLMQKNYVVSGWNNYFNTLLLRLMPRRTTIYSVRTVWKKIIDKKKADR